MSDPRIEAVARELRTISGGNPYINGFDIGELATRLLDAVDRATIARLYETHELTSRGTWVPRASQTATGAVGGGERWEQTYTRAGERYNKAVADGSERAQGYWQGYMDGMIATRAADATEDRHLAPATPVPEDTDG
jgi:hypothetical protein